MSDDGTAEGAERDLSSDEVAELTEQQAYLLRSLDDLDAEFAAGDIGADDYATLRDDYTRRAAAVLRAIEARRATVRAETAPPSATRRRLLTAGVVVVVALVAGFALARTVGYRGDNDGVTGDVRASTRTLLLEAGQLGGEGNFDDAIATYDDVLEIQPSNAEALTYKAWYRYLSDDSAAADAEVEALLDQAVIGDPDFPDAWVFRAVLFTNQQRFSEAAEALAAFEGTDPPPAMVELVADQGLRERVLVGRLLTAVAADPDTTITVEAFDTDATTMARAGRILAADGEAGVAVRAYGAALDADPDELTALLGRGALLVATAQETAATDPTTAAELLASGRASIDRAVEVDPSSVDARLLAAQVAVLDDDPDAARAMLAGLDGDTLSADQAALADSVAALLDG